MNIAGYTSSLVVGTKSWQQMNLRHRWLIETLNTDSPLATVSEVAIKNLATFSILDFFTCGPVFPRNPWGLIISPGESTQWAGGHADSCCCAGRPWGGLPQPPKTLKNPIFTIRATYQAHFNYQPLTSKQIPLQISHVNKSLTSSTNTTSSNIRFRIKTANSSIQS